ncbi:OB-fold domain-containing protein [Aspergillus chevalieri]|uniref:CST complex subunit Stn1 N-terminal domain-containing protein n=1 Tax=Aspergillus chevalieri TaxID=182096 RepID=A0A7R7VP20_ASPCH|nr:uncharacterized protein ACHE_40780S [Aspergillus chevalieri]BCR88216.1 hypothetical protein ACHE_40780S [Aspergillus chevalieri]
METVDNDSLAFYPAFCFKASPTHFAWVKMAAVDVHRLKKRPGFEGQNIYFYLNHPIRFVCLVGLIVARTDVYKRTILTLDDSSGSTIEIAVLKSEQFTPPEGTEQGQQQHHHQQGSKAQTQPIIEMHVTATDKTYLDISSLVPGTLVKVKGTLSTFRSAMQLNLERFFPVPDTNAEMQFLDQRIRFLVEVLWVPWVLSEDEIAQLRTEAEEEQERLEEEQDRIRRRHRKRVEREERDQRRIQKLWEREERLREKEAASCQAAGRKIMRELETRKRLREE